ncbi:MAG: hypothetical protein KAJ49_02565 [Arcobacteraceae bacterium]|nr:hypothetical protein [Arcobacteraceae bacterium]
MTRRSIGLFYIIGGLFSILIFQSIYLLNTKSMTDDILNQKLTFVKIIGLPDLAIATEASYTRHRSLANIFSIYQDDGNLREYFPTSFVYNHSTLVNNIPNRIVND